MMTDLELLAFISNWADQQRIAEADRERMLARAAEDPDYWASEPCWKLYDVSKRESAEP